MHKIFLQIIIFSVFSFPAFAGQITPVYIQEKIPSAAFVGQGRMSYMLWDLYDAALYAPQGQWQEGKPLALSLTYLRDLNGRKIADKSVEEMRTQGFKDEVRLAEWHNQMTGIFPDVVEGTTLTGILGFNGETVFYQDGYEIGHIVDPEFGRRFFAIWLNEDTSAPELRSELLGLNAQRG